MSQVSYLSDIRDQMYDKLNTNLGGEFYVEKFWSNDVFEALAHLRDNRGRLSNYTYVLVSATGAVQQTYRQAQLYPQDRVSINLFIAARDNMDPNRATDRVEFGTLISRAYLSQGRFSTDFSNEGFVAGWEPAIEWEDDELVVYSLSGNLDLELDLEEVINTYES